MINQIKKAFLICLLCVSAVVNAQNSSVQTPYVDKDNRSYLNTGLVCTNNDYALCSHAECGCVDGDGNAIDCQPFVELNSNDPAGWARCECPIVETTKTIYAANYASPDLTCDERENPSEYDSKYQLPEFVTAAGETTDIYSTYSFGDSLPDSSFGTDQFDKGLICDTKLFADCLNMACYIPEGEGTAVCYCKNRLTAAKLGPNNEADITCPSLSWNTFGGDCDSNNCSYDEVVNVWSGACIDDTMSAMADVYAAIRVLEIDVTSKFIPAYCE